MHTSYVRSWVAMLAAACLAESTLAADLPVRQVTLYKHGVGYFERSGDLKAGDTVRLDFKAEEMTDVLKSLTVSGAAKIAGIRYDASDSIEHRLDGFPFEVGKEVSLAAFLDQMKGARLDIGGQAGTIVSARVVKAEANRPERELVVLLT